MFSRFHTSSFTKNKGREGFCGKAESFSVDSVFSFETRPCYRGANGLFKLP